MSSCACEIDSTVSVASARPFASDCSCLRDVVLGLATGFAAATLRSFAAAVACAPAMDAPPA
jgi:hypothetical protein